MCEIFFVLVGGTGGRVIRESCCQTTRCVNKRCRVINKKINDQF